MRRLPSTVFLLATVLMLASVPPAFAGGTISIPEEIHAGEVTTVRVTPETVDPSDQMFFGWLNLKGSGAIKCPFPFPANTTLGGRWFKGFEFRPASRPISVQVEPSKADSNGLYLFCAYQGEGASTAEAFPYAEKIVRILPPTAAYQRETRSCGQIPKGSVYSIEASRSVACGKARTVIRKFAFDGDKHPLGYQCHEGRRGKYEVVITCRRGLDRVVGVTGI